ncbi:hypothetical protein Clacol_001829 [Clathrus columnatus]|uniref:triacylglycerol lipase n=1 Tax=Clathrus columnatus TaxID=1419009 RepID=A0AAV5A3P0_9AGAM|nr:hypothetical protein Clacol_001829 [Clathrus columnatus]
MATLVEPSVQEFVNHPSYAITFVNLSSFESRIVWARSTYTIDFNTDWQSSILVSNLSLAFLVAWAGIAAQTAKLLGLLSLGIDLRRLGALKWEFYLFSILLSGAFVVMFVSNALSVGTLKELPNSSTDAICFRERHIGTGAATIAIDIVLEVYCVARMMYFLVPGFLYPRHKVQALFDIRVARSLSLLALDIAIAPQMFTFFGVLADAIPSSLVTVVVLAAFNQHSPFSSIPPTASIPFTRPGSAYSRSTIEIRKMPSTHSLQHISHPFAANALLDPTPETEDWPASAALAPQFPEPTLIKSLSYRSSNHLSVPPVTSHRRVSALSEGDSDAWSIKNAVRGFAFRSKDITKGAQAPRSAKAELVLLTKSGNPMQSLPMSPITPASQQPHIEITLAHDENNNLPDDSPLSVPSRASALPSPRVSDITSLNSSSTSRKGTLSILTSSNSDPGSIGPPLGRNRSVSDHHSSLHFTPTTPAPPHLSSHRASTDSGEWKYDTYLVPEPELKRASYVSRGTENHSSSSSFVIDTLSPPQEFLSPGPPQSQRYSVTLPPADDDLSIVYEASHEESDSLIPPSRAARPHTLTFGQPPPVLTVDLDNLAFSDVIERAERSVTISVAGETTDGEGIRGIREDMFVAGGIGRSIATPVGVPEDVDGRLGNGSGSGSGSEDVKYDHNPLQLLEDHESLYISAVPITVYRPSSFESFMHARRRFRPSFHDRVYGNDYSNIFSLDEDYRLEDKLFWTEETVEAPDVTDRETLLSLAKMTRNAYLDISGGVSEEWYELDGYNASFPFGWEEDADGLRGHVFVTGDNSTVIIAIKGTSLTFLGGGEPTAKRDKLNDNLLFSCCCAAIDFTWTPKFVQSNVSRREFTGRELVLFYCCCHSLGGAVASLVAVTFGIPAVTFEAPGERMAAERLHLPLPPSTQHVTHVYHTADPIAMGTCNGIFSACTFAGYAMESSCHLGQTIVYDTVTELGWTVDVRTHPIKVIVEKLLANKWVTKDQSGDDPVPKARPQEDCVECYRWDFA